MIYPIFVAVAYTRNLDFEPFCCDIKCKSSLTPILAKNTTNRTEMDLLCHMLLTLTVTLTCRSQRFCIIRFTVHCTYLHTVCASFLARVTFTEFCVSTYVSVPHVMLISGDPSRHLRHHCSSLGIVSQSSTRKVFFSPRMGGPVRH